MRGFKTKWPPPHGARVTEAVSCAGGAEPDAVAERRRRHPDGGARADGGQPGRASAVGRHVGGGRLVLRRRVSRHAAEDTDATEEAGDLPHRRGAGGDAAPAVGAARHDLRPHVLLSVPARRHARGAPHRATIYLHGVRVWGCEGVWCEGVGVWGFGGVWCEGVGV